MRSDWNRNFPSRRNIFLIGGGVLFAGLTARLAQLQIVQGSEFQKAAENNQIRLLPAPAHRGTVYDRNGRILAGSKRNFYVTLRREKAGSVRDVADTLDRLATLIPLSDQKKRSVLQDATNQAAFVDVLVADDLTWEEFSRVNVMAPELAGVSAEVGELRSYPFQKAFFHTVGYVTKASEKDVTNIIQGELTAMKLSPESDEGKARMAAIKRLYKNPQMRVGKQGLEAYGERALKGEPGNIRVLQNANGRVIDRLPSDDIAGKPGAELVLSLDAELQNYAIGRFGNESGTAIVIDIKTGDVLTMMSTPSPDPNSFVSGIGSADYKALNDDIRIPLLHKAYDGLYPPGSTFKIIVATAALESGAMSPTETVYCKGRSFYYTRDYACWEPKGHGSMNMHTGMKNSCDCYFYEAGRRTGIEKIAEVAKKFGISHRYELGITGGKVGIAPNDEWKRRVKKEKWYEGDTISAAIGQGYVTITPVEMAVMCARIAGGHSVPNPHLVDSGITVPDNTITPLGDIKEEHLEIVRAGMRAVCSPEERGTAWRFGLLDPDNTLPAPYTGARMAGKSGSAQVRAIAKSERNASGKAKNFREYDWIEREHAHFVAYAPADNPRYAIAITVEHGGSGSQVAAPFAHDILRKCLELDPGNKPLFKPNTQTIAANPPKAERT
jgi:penicillin-binding protein 2